MKNFKFLSILLALAFLLSSKQTSAVVINNPDGTKVWFGGCPPGENCPLTKVDSIYLGIFQAITQVIQNTACAGAGVRNVDTLFLNVSNDSIAYNVNGIRRSISIPAGTVSYTYAKNTSKDSNVLIINGIRKAVKDSIGIITYSYAKNTSKDSSVLTINGVRIAIKDSTGTGVTQTTINDSMSVINTRLDTKTNKLLSPNRQNASYTLVLSDADKIIEMNVASSNNLTVPLNSSIAYSVGTQILLIQYGAGQTTIVPTGGVTIHSDGAKLKIASQYSAATLIKIDTNEWYLIGNLSN